MKILHYFLYCFIAIFLTACNSNELGVKYTLCKDKVSGRGLPGEDESYLTYKVEGNTLKVKMYNHLTNCGTEEITVDSTHGEANQINVKLTEIGLSANCFCPADVSFTLSDLKKGETYHCIIESNSAGFNIYHQVLSFTFIMKNGESGKITF